VCKIIQLSQKRRFNLKYYQQKDDADLHNSRLGNKPKDKKQCPNEYYGDYNALLAILTI
jgi:hypothetical protein